MIIWLNGAFGSGKSTVATKLNNILDKSIIYDPELIGGFLNDTLPMKKDDFQDYELWRTLNYEVLKYLSCAYDTIIVPMTVTNRMYYDEIVGKLRSDNIELKSFILMASKDNLIKRLNERGNSTEWSYQQIDRCCTTFNGEFDGIKIDTNDNDIEKVKIKILDLL